MGCAIARVARRRGAEVTLVAGPTAVPLPPGVRTVPVTTADEMARSVEAAFPHATTVVMAAAVADYRPSRTLDQKLKKDGRPFRLELEPNPDILRRLAARKGRRLLVGFAAETRDVVAEARRKLAAKRLDLIVGNDVTAPGAAVGGDTNVVHLIDASGHEEALPVLSKEEVAERILDWVVAHRRLRRIAARRSGGSPRGG